MAPRVFDPKLAISFHAVVEAGSITAGANTSGVTQPWMSEQIRKLEQQLGGRLLLRTSRSLSMTDLGHDFIPYARAIAQANDAAQGFAATVLERLDTQLVIGACQYSSGLPARARLIEQLVRQHPQLKVEVRQGRSMDLVEMLTRGSLDMILVHQLGIVDLPEIDFLTVVNRFGFLMMRDDDPLAKGGDVSLYALAGRRLFIGPGRDDPRSMLRSLHPLIDAGIVLAHCPDTDRAVIENLAMEAHELCIAWEEVDKARPATPGRVIKRISQCTLSSPIALARRAGSAHARAIRQAWDIGTAMNQSLARKQPG